MKKRLLITSIVMMLVVAVALSTATYAWFTSNAKATATQVTMVATTSNAPALGISWTDGNYGTSITPDITDYATDNTFTFAPVAPVSLWTEAVTTGEQSAQHGITTSDVAFKTSTTYSSAGDFKFGAAGADPTKQATYVVTDGNGHNSFFLKNLSGTNALTGTLTMTVEIEANENYTDKDGSELIRVGVFKYNAEATTTDKYELIEVLANQDAYTYTGISSGAMTALANNAKYYKFVNGQYVEAVQGENAAALEAGADWYVGMTASASQFYTRTDTDADAKAVYGTIAKDASVNAMNTYTCATSLDLGTNLPANTVIELRVIIWMDAAALGDAQQGNVANITLNFNVA